MTVAGGGKSSETLSDSIEKAVFGNNKMLITEHQQQLTFSIPIDKATVTYHCTKTSSEPNECFKGLQCLCKRLLSSIERFAQSPIPSCNISDNCGCLQYMWTSVAPNLNVMLAFSCSSVDNFIKGEVDSRLQCQPGATSFKRHITYSINSKSTRRGAIFP